MSGLVLAGIIVLMILEGLGSLTPFIGLFIGGIIFLGYHTGHIDQIDLDAFVADSPTLASCTLDRINLDTTASCTTVDGGEVEVTFNLDNDTVTIRPVVHAD